MILSDTIQIARSPGEVFAVLERPESQMKWMPERAQGVRQVSGDGPGRGARYLGKYKGSGWVELEVTDYEPPRRLAQRMTVMGIELETRWRCEPSPGGSRLEQAMEARARGLMRLFLPLMKPMLRSTLRGINAALKRHLESI